MSGYGWHVAALLAGLLGAFIPEQSSWDRHVETALAVGNGETS